MLHINAETILSAKYPKLSGRQIYELARTFKKECPGTPTTTKEVLSQINARHIVPDPIQPWIIAVDRINIRVDKVKVLYRTLTHYYSNTVGYSRMIFDIALNSITDNVAITLSEIVIIVPNLDKYYVLSLILSIY